MAFFEQRKNGWRAQVRKRGMPSISRTFDLKADAEAWAREIERELQRGNAAVLRDDAGKTTLADVIKKYVEGPVQTLRSKADMTRYMRAAKERFGKMFLSSIRAVDVASWRRSLDKKFRTHFLFGARDQGSQIPRTSYLLPMM
jgi:hypothetical protein